MCGGVDFIFFFQVCGFWLKYLNNNPVNSYIQKKKYIKSFLKIIIIIFEAIIFELEIYFKVFFAYYIENNSNEYLLHRSRFGI